MVDQTKTTKHRFLILLSVLLFYVVVTPFLYALIERHLLIDIVMTFVFIAAMHAIVRKKTHIVFGLLLALPMIISIWQGYLFESLTFMVIGRLFGIMFFGFAIFGLLRFILAAEKVTSEVLFAAVIIYLLMAMMWSFVYVSMEIIVPGSFNLAGARIKETQFVFLYYSFVTITTLGYGDITPATHQAGALTILEAIVGQIYLVVLVAFLVGMYVSRRSK